MTDIDRDTLEYTVDVSVEGGGWNLYGAFIGRNDDFRGSGGESEFDDFAVIAQGGFRLGAKWEPYIRYEAFFLDSDRGFEDDTNNILTVGVNHYIAGHAIKVSGDLVIPSSRIPPTWSLPASCPTRASACSATARTAKSSSACSSSCCSKKQQRSLI